MKNNLYDIRLQVLQKCSSSHSSNSSGKSTTSSSRVSVSPLKTTTSLSANSSPLKLLQTGCLTPLQESSGSGQNSITLQVSTNLSPLTQEQRLPSVQSSVTLASNASSTTTISGSPGTKIYVQQNSSPMRSVITFENNSGTAKPSNADKEEKQEKEALANEKCNRQAHRPERPSSLYATSRSESDKENKPAAAAKQQQEPDEEQRLKPSNNRLNNSQAHLTDGSSKESNDAMNNSRKLSLSLSKDALSYRNLLHRPASKNNLVSSNPPSPTKSYDNFGGSFNNVYIEKLDKLGGVKPAAQQGSEPSLDKSLSRSELYSYPSLSDMQLQFTSLAAQKILKGCPLNSVDTLVEVNMAAQDKPNNCDVTVHTDFGLV